MTPIQGPRLSSRLLLALLTLLVSATGLHAQQAGASPVKIFIMAGQSNMVGQGNINPLGTSGTLATITRNEHKFPNLLDGTRPRPRRGAGRGQSPQEPNKPLNKPLE